ncbi:MAG: chloride channel protein [Alphaproteobacteria bacterium]|nr:chloride channel protein [Alphaproteobacteria bacterium]MBU0795661.1 chloride channel protein [Alphaproteobacteria bacterium]MBU0887284.1 chloride channel protein [Alphaproteobacteria bacterium]MBU1811835.1 chloride channel protein [Alphaproteobacteria bacterium]
MPDETPAASPLGRLLGAIRRLLRQDHIKLSILSVIIGVAAAIGAILFREAIEVFQLIFLGFEGDRVASLSASQPWWRILLAPTLGGVLIGLLIQYVMPGGVTRGVPDVIEASALRGGRIGVRGGLGSAVLCAMSIGSGASVGREGPAVHLGATVASWLSRRFGLGRSSVRVLLGCGVASAVSASFNAPMAGAFFALEVVIGHYGLQAFAPIVVASVLGAIVSRMHFGDFPAFVVPDAIEMSVFEYPAFILLGLCSAAVAVIFVRSVDWAEWGATRFAMPRFVRTGAAGLAIGLIALLFPEILGVGYEATDRATQAQYGFWMLVALLVAKMAATAIALGGGFPGGVFSPALFLGAMLGGAFGIVAEMPFPQHAAGAGAYTLIGMAAVSAGVLGAPISTVLMLFEMTGDYQITIAAMVAVALSSLVTRQVLGHSYFTWQLAKRGLSIKGGHEVGILQDIKVRSLLRTDQETVGPDDDILELRAHLLKAPQAELFVVQDRKLLGILTLADLGSAAFEGEVATAPTARQAMRTPPPFLSAEDDLEAAVKLFSQIEEGLLPVVEDRRSMRLIGCLHERDVMRAYNKALIRLRAEEHGEKVTD